MHHHRIFFRHGNDLGVDLIRPKRAQAVLCLFFLAHAGPDIGVDPNDAGHSFLDEISNGDFGPLDTRLLQHRQIRFVTLRASQRERERHDGGGFQPGMNHIVAIADKDDFQTIKSALMFNQRLAIG